MGAGRSSLAVFLFLVVATASLAVAASAEETRPPAVLWIQRAQGRMLQFPVDVAVDQKGVLFLLESGSRSISLFSPKGEFLREIHGKGSWKDPMAISLAPDGTILLADGDAGRVLEIELSGRIRREYQAGRNARITGVGIYGGTIFCVDNRNCQVVTFRRGGGKSESWGRKGDRPGEFNSPFRLAIDAGGRVFISDVMNARIQWFSAFGQHLGTLKRFGAGEGRIFRPSGISLDNRGRIWVCDGYSGLVQLFEEKGGYVRTLAEGGRPHLFESPIGVAAGPDGVWVADQREGRLALFRK